MLARLALSITLGLGVLAGCSNDSGDVACNLDSCTVTMKRGVDASASVLGVDIKLVAVTGDTVTIEVEGNKVNVPVGNSAQTQVAGLNVSVKEVTGEKVVLNVTRA